MQKSICILFIVLLYGCSNHKTDDLNQFIKHSEKQLEIAVVDIDSIRSERFVFPRTIENGRIKLVSAEDWTSGFFPGNLWMMYELTGKSKWKELALEYTLPLENEKWNGTNHDTGFKMYCSFGNAIKHSNKDEFKDILIQSAKTLSTRYNPVVGCIRSWDSNANTSQWKYPVIIDNMMNLELLLWAAKETGNESFKEIAIKHAQATMKNHFRADYSCYHVVDYSPETGEVLSKNTHQGFNDESAWARGQAWAVYGFTMMYRETGMTEFLVHAQKVANYLLNQDELKKGKVPYWDFDAPKVASEPYDASAAAVISAALFELYEFANDEKYLNVAKQLFTTLSGSDFLAPVGENGGFLLKHSTGSKPYNSEIDVPLVYADYYYLEALIRYRNYEENKLLVNMK
jgi:uncharacterized protein YyaL (SSP411 family)